MKPSYAAEPGMAAGPDWTTWFPASGRLPTNPRDACEQARARLAATGLRVEHRAGQCSLRVLEAGPGEPVAVRVEFDLDSAGALRVRYRPSAVPNVVFGNLVDPLRPLMALFFDFAGAWTFATRVDKLLRRP